MARRKASPLGRFLRFIVLTVCALVLAAIGAVWYFGPKDSLAFVIRESLAWMGYGPVAVDVTRLDADGITLENFSAGRNGALVMRKAKLDFKDGGPLAGGKALVIDGLIYAASFDAGRFDSGFALRPSSSASAFALPKLPFPVVVNDSRGRLNTPYGTLDVVSALAARFEQGALDASYDLSFLPGGTGKGAIGAHRGTLTVASDAEGAIDLALTLAPGGAGPASSVRSSASPNGDSPGGPASGVARAVAVKGGTFKLTARAKGQPRNGPFSAQAELSEVALPAFDLALRRATFEATRDAGAPDTGVALTLDGFDAFKVSFAHAAINGVLEGRGDIHVLHLPECATVEDVTYDGTATPLHADFPKLCGALDADTLAQLRGQTLDFAVKILDATVRDAPAGTPAGFTGTLPQITLTGNSTPDGWRGELKGDGGDLHAVDAHIVFNDILLDGNLSQRGGASPQGAFAVTHLLMSDMDKPARFAPLTLKGESTLADDTVKFALLGALAGVEKLAVFEGLHTLSSGVGEATFDLPKLTFAPGGLQPATLSPLLAGQLSSVGGALEARGKFAWTSDGLTSDGTFNIEELGGTGAFGLIAGMNGSVAFSSLVPLQTKDSQTINIKMLDVGLPLPDGTIKFRLLPEGRLVVEHARWPLMDGTIGLSSALIDFARAENNATLAVDHIDLAQLLVLADVDGLSGTGTLSGQIPVRFEGTHQYIAGGKLAAEPPGGTLIYKSATGDAAAGAAQESKILFQALDNFRYEALDATLDGDLAGDLSVKVHLKGHNPELYEGYPIELNVNTDGPFVAMLKKSLFAVHDVTQPR